MSDGEALDTLLEKGFVLNRARLRELIVIAWAREINSEDHCTQFTAAKSLYCNLKKLGFCEHDACWMAVGDKGRCWGF